MFEPLPTPAIVIDASIVERNVQRMAEYASAHHLDLRPHTKTHKSVLLAQQQLDCGAVGLTVAKAGEAQVMSAVCDDVLVAYTTVDPHRGGGQAPLARGKTVRVAVDSTVGAEALSAAARAAGTTLGILVDLDTGFHRTGVQSAAEALALAQHVARLPGLRLDGLMFFPGELASTPPEQQPPALKAIDALLAEVIDLWKRSGLEAAIVSGGSTPTAYQSHLVPHLTEIRPGTYIFNDLNTVKSGGSGGATIEDCAARILTTVVSTAVPGQIVLDAGSKTLTSDRSRDTDGGFGLVVEYPGARITKLSEEHAQVDVRHCDPIPGVGDRVTVIPNHICPCINLQDQFWWCEPGQAPRPLPVDARGKVH